VPVHQTIKRHFPEDGHLDEVLECSSSEGFGEQPLMFLSESKDEYVKPEINSCTALSC